MHCEPRVARVSWPDIVDAAGSCSTCGTAMSMWTKDYAPSAGVAANSQSDGGCRRTADQSSLPTIRCLRHPMLDSELEFETEDRSAHPVGARRCRPGLQRQRARRRFEIRRRDTREDLRRQDHQMERRRPQDTQPRTNLPDEPITVAHRSDGSGTTVVWTDYLTKESPSWVSAGRITKRASAKRSLAHRDGDRGATMACEIYQQTRADQGRRRPSPTSSTSSMAR